MASKQLISVVLGVIVVAVVAVVALAAMGNDDKPSKSANSTTDTNQSTKLKDDTTNGSSDDSTNTRLVTIEDFKYGPATITVKVGTTVKWTNQDSVRHNVVTDGESGPDGPLLAQGESYSFTFDKPGTYNYFCQPHPYMKGTVVVTE